MAGDDPFAAVARLLAERGNAVALTGAWQILPAPQSVGTQAVGPAREIA